MPDSFTDPAKSTSATTETIESTRVEIQHDRGILYVYGRDGKPLLKITGLPRPIPRLKEVDGGPRPLTIEIRQQGVICNWGATPTVVTPSNPIPHLIEDDPWRDERGDTAYIAQMAGATIHPGEKK
jgi:hypothetical protein